MQKIINCIYNVKRMPYLLKFETTKLFYNEYAYKLVVRNQLSHLFREKNYAWAKQNLDKLQSQLENSEEQLVFTRGLRSEYIERSEFQQAQILFHEFTNFNDMKLRVEHPRIQVYSNNLNWLKRLATKVKNVVEFWEPDSSNINLLEANTIVVHQPTTMQYKITLGKKTASNFTNWVDSNPDKVRMGPVTYNEIQNNGYTKGLYFYVRDEKVLNLVNLIVGGNIQRVDKIVYSPKTDK